MSTSASAPAVAPAKSTVRHWGTALLQLATRRRIGVSAALFTTLVVCDVLLWKTRPCNLFDLTDPGTLPGELLLLTGLVLRTWAAGTLFKSKQLITGGPYQFVRNPLYIGSFLMMFGFAILLRDWLAIWVVLGPVLAMYLNKVQQEERYLAFHFPEAWSAYAEQTPRFVPQWSGRPSLGGFSLRQWAQNREYQALAASLLGLVALWCWYQASA